MSTRTTILPNSAAALLQKSAPDAKSSSPAKSVLRVNFSNDPPEISDRKKKYLTAKYGQHQMNLIKKRLRVEMWTYDQLQYLFDVSDEDENSKEVEIDLDELLDIEGDSKRKIWLKNQLLGVKKSTEVVERFVNELLEKANTL